VGPIFFFLAAIIGLPNSFRFSIVLNSKGVTRAAHADVVFFKEGVKFINNITELIIYFKVA